MPRCYLLSVCCGSSLDQHSNNISLFSLVEQVNVMPGAPPPPRGMLPLEIHAYFHLDPSELNQDFELRYVLLAASGFETPSETSRHKSPTLRFRARSAGVPFPPVVGHYQLCVDSRQGGRPWQRDPIRWPLSIVEEEQRPRVTH